MTPPELERRGYSTISHATAGWIAAIIFIGGYCFAMGFMIGAGS